MPWSQLGVVPVTAVDDAPERHACAVHLIRAAMRFVSYTDRRAVTAALRPIYGRQRPGCQDGTERVRGLTAGFPTGDAAHKPLWLATCNTEDQHACDLAKERGLPGSLGCQVLRDRAAAAQRLG